MWGNDAFDLLGQSKWHELWRCKIDAAAKRDAEVDPEYLTVGRVDQEVLQVSVANADEVRCDREDSDALDELVLDRDECLRSQAQVLETCPQQVPRDHLLLLLEGIDHEVRLHFEKFEMLSYNVMHVLIARDFLEPFFFYRLSHIAERL